MRQPERVRWQLHPLNTGTIFGMARWGVNHFPFLLSEGIGRGGSWLAYHLMREATSALIDNLRVVVPEMGECDLRALALRAYRSYARETADFMRSLSMDRDAISAWISPQSRFDHVPAQGTGELFLTGHIGNLELGAVMLRVLLDYPLTAMVLPDRDPDVAALRREMRASLGIETLQVRHGFDTALRIRRLLAEGRIVAIIGDRPLGRDRIDVEFFGRRTSFLRTPALMGYLTGAPLVPAFILRQPDGRYAGFTAKPIRVSPTGDRDANVRAAVQAFASVLEQKVREYPHLWYQFYPYWGRTTEPSGADVAPEP
jgi:lauroyl/myristoyl acyltransferase